MNGVSWTRGLISAAILAGVALAATAAEQPATPPQRQPATPLPPAPPKPAPDPNSLEGHIKAAVDTAGPDLGGILTVCLPRNGPDPRPANDSAEPTKVFDNLYYVGIQSVSAWALTTSQGIIILDTLNNAQEAQTFIEGGLRKLRLDPAQIKYIVITHAHADHYGGATYLADKFHAQLVMSDADWKFLEGPQPARGQTGNRGPIPKRGMAVNDGDKLTLGDTTLEFYITPPHTPGTISIIMPLKDGGMNHVGAEWGGTAFNFQPTAENFATYAASAERFMKVAAGKGADVPISNHATFDDALSKMSALKMRKPGDPHPFATGANSVQRYLTVAAECAKARATALAEDKKP
jgi:metallo-beta-lactamase class B